MKNKIKYKILILFFISIFQSALAENEFIFESTTIEYKEDENLVVAKGDVKITSSNSLTILADESRYFKLSNKLFLKGNVKIIDEDKDIIIESNKIEYFKNIELIKSDGTTSIKISKNYIINTSGLNYLITKKTIDSNNKTTLVDKFNNKVETESFIYFVQDKKFKSKNLKITDKDLNEYLTNNALIDLNTNKIAAKDVQIYFSKNSDFGNNARLKGNSMTSDNNITIINKGIFTTCKPRDDCPPWTMQSKTITHNKEKKIIEYEKAWLKLYDKPIFYFPKFFHPDPTVKRRSGFLIPSMTTSSNSGNSLNIPYFIALADNKDFTFSPRIYFNNDILIQNEYRQVEENFNHVSDFSLKKHEKGSKSHIFSNTKINLMSDDLFKSNLEINVEKTSNDTYLKSEKLKSSIQNNQSLLNSFVKYESFNDETDFLLEIASYEDLTKTKNSDKYQFILPSFKFSKILLPGADLNGNLRFSTSGVSQKRDTNITENYLINNFDFTSDRILSNNGFVSSFDLLFKNVSKKGQNSSKYKDDFTNKNFLLTNYMLSFPLKKVKNNFTSNLSPKLSLRYNPFDNENLTNSDRKINNTNIFSTNRLGMTDSLEGGQSLTLGFDYDLFNKDDTRILSSSLGQIFKDKNDNKLPITSKMQNKSSDIVGQIIFTPNDIFEIDYNYSADNNLDTMNYNFLETKLEVNNFVASFDFLEENNDIGSDSYFSRDIGYKLDQNNMISYTTRRNRRTDLTEYYNLIYQYKNDCLVAAIEYNKNYYEDRDVRPNEEIYFSLTITPFTSVNSPNINK
jgi:LPS-assembly protein